MSKYDKRGRMTRAQLNQFVADYTGNCKIHALDNGDGTYSIMAHVVCEWCDYCKEQEDHGIELHDARPDPYARVGRGGCDKCRTLS